MAGQLRYNLHQRVLAQTERYGEVVGQIIAIREQPFPYQVRTWDGTVMYLLEREIVRDLPVSNAWADVERWLDAD